MKRNKLNDGSSRPIDEERSDDNLRHSTKGSHDDRSTDSPGDDLTNNKTTKEFTVAIKHPASSTSKISKIRKLPSQTTNRKLSAQARTKNPTSFLSLPRELRHKIFFESVYPRKYPTIQEYHKASKKYFEPSKFHVICSPWWATMINVHPQLEDDVDYVKTKLDAYINEFNHWVQGTGYQCH